MEANFKPEGKSPGEEQSVAPNQNQSSYIVPIRILKKKKHVEIN